MIHPPYRLRKSSEEVNLDCQLRADKTNEFLSEIINEINKEFKINQIDCNFSINFSELIQIYQESYLLSAAYQVKCVFTKEQLKGNAGNFGSRLYPPKKLAIIIYCYLAHDRDFLFVRGSDYENKDVLRAKEHIVKSLIQFLMISFLKLNLKQQNKLNKILQKKQTSPIIY